MRRALKLALATALLVVWACGAAAAQELDAPTVLNWLEQFAQALTALPMQNDPSKTADPARPGEYLIEYEFGTVLSRSVSAPAAQDILEIDVRTSQVTDCRGMRVGMSLAEALAGEQVPAASTQLVVLGTQDSGIGWHWAYVGQSGVYGLEWITYDMTDPAAVREFTLTYVIGEDGTLSAIRVRVADSTQAQAEAGLQTAQEIAGRQMGEVLAIANDAAMFSEQDLQIMDHQALGTPVYELVSLLGEPVEVQELPAGGGRILLYEGAAIQLGLDEQTGVEIVLGVTVSGTGLTGPRGVCVGMSVQEAASLFRCDADLYAAGGTLYMEGEARGEAPYGEMTALQGSESALRYICSTASQGNACLDVGLLGGTVSYWHLYREGGKAEDDP